MGLDQDQQQHPTVHTGGVRRSRVRGCNFWRLRGSVSPVYRNVDILLFKYIILQDIEEKMKILTI